MNKIKQIFIKPGRKMNINFCIIAALIGVYIYHVVGEGFSWPAFWACMGLIAAIGLLLNMKFKLKGVPGLVAMLILPPACFYLIEAYSHNAFMMEVPLQLLNIGFYYVLFALLFFITGRAKAAGIIGTLFPMIVGIANYYTVCFRSSPILPWDLMSLRTAMSVTSNYNFAVEFRMLVVALAFVLVIVIASKIQLRLPKINVKNIIGRVAGAVVCSALVVLLTWGLQVDSVKSFFNLEETLFTPNYLYKTNGFAVSFIYDLQYIEMKKPSGYSVANVETIMEPYEASDAVDQPDSDQENGNSAGSVADKPNIIVIMNEAFSDLSVLGDFQTNEDYMPFIHNLTEDTVKGNLFVSVKGGNTANTEFEFLTGHSMAFLPQGSVAYQQYVNREMPTLTSYLGSLGYKTAGLHPYYASGWDRDEVYPYFGFDETYFIYDFKHKDILRKYVSDRSAFDQIIDLYEQKDNNDRLFAFEVTMQNHGGYYEDFDNFIPNIKLEFNASSAKVQHYTELYLSLIRESDAAFESMVEYFKNQDEKTVIVMFGDHQPADIIASPVLALNGKSNDTSLENQQNRYIVPFVIWANYDIEEKEIDRISVNYLSTLLMDVAGLEKTGYQKFLSELYEKLPVITGNVYIDSEGNYYNTSDNPYSDILEQYQALQYYHLFDKDKSLTDFYGVMPETVQQ